MKRRFFLTAAAVWPLAPSIAGHGDQPRRVGALFATGENDAEGQRRLSTLMASLERLGWVEGQNLQLMARWSDGDPERARIHAEEIISAQVDVVLTNGAPATAAVQNASSTIPIVFVQVGDPVAWGFLDGLARPGRNATGFTSYEPSFPGKWLELLKDINPSVRRVGFLHNAQATGREPLAGFRRFFDAFSRALAIEPISLPIREASEIELVVRGFASAPNTGMLVPPNIFMTAHRHAIIRAAAENRLPTVYPYRFFAVDGGLVSYGVDLLNLYPRAAAYIDRILRGERPSDMPAQQPTKFELVVNLRTASALNLAMPPSLLARADEVIE